MTPEDYAEQMLRKVAPEVLSFCLREGTHPSTSTTKRLKAIDLLTRIASAPKGRRPDDVTVREALAALALAAPLLLDTLHNHSSARIRQRASKLILKIAQLGKSS